MWKFDTKTLLWTWFVRPLLLVYVRSLTISACMLVRISGTSTPNPPSNYGVFNVAVSPHVWDIRMGCQLRVLVFARLHRTSLPDMVHLESLIQQASSGCLEALRSMVRYSSSCEPSNFTGTLHTQILATTCGSSTPRRYSGLGAIRLTVCVELDSSSCMHRVGGSSAASSAVGTAAAGCNYGVKTVPVNHSFDPAAHSC
jgi:hypothetical protein